MTAAEEVKDANAATKVHFSSTDTTKTNPRLTCPDDNDDRHHRGPPPQRQRRHYDPPGTRLRKKLSAFLDSGFHTPEQEINDIGSLVLQHSSDEYVRDTFGDILISVAIEQPCKTLFLAGLLMSVNRSEPTLVKEVVEKVAVVVTRDVRAGKWREVKLGLKLLACCQGVFEGDGVIGLLEELFQRTIDLQSANPEEVSWSMSTDVLCEETDKLVIDGRTGVGQDYSTYHSLHYGFDCYWTGGED